MFSPVRTLQRITKWFPGPTGRVLIELFTKIAEWPATFVGAAPTIASATTIAPTTPVAFVSGTTAIVNITVPSHFAEIGDSAGHGAQIVFIPTGAFTWTAAGNIAVLGTAVVNRALTMTYDSVTAKFYPSYV